MQRSYFLSCCTSVVPRIIFKTHLAEEKMGLLFSDLNWIEHSNDLNGYFLHVFGTNLVYYAVSLPKGLWLWRSHFPSLPQTQFQGHLWEKVGGEAKLFAQSEKGAVPFPWNHRADSGLRPISGPSYSPISQPLTSLENSPPSPELIVVLGLHWIPSLIMMRRLSVI